MQKRLGNDISGWTGPAAKMDPIEVDEVEVDEEDLPSNLPSKTHHWYKLPFNFK